MSLEKKKNLSEIPLGELFLVQEIKSQPKTRQRLQELGFSENAVVRTILSSSSRLICEVQNTRIGIRSRVAKDILVSPMK
jgi:Fe2+ transport system protein FeoA